ncbi:MAG TPA: hypothetical protein VMA95_18770 [Streptosporangiaceae bacterium]|nr:hypothetical protein [Streptosporangiaceae bacterium]
MLIATGSTAQDAASSRVLIILAAIALVVYWRPVLKILLAIVAVTAIVLLGAGALEFLNVTHG